MPVYNILAANDDTLFCATYPYLKLTEDGGDDWISLSIQPTYPSGLEYNEFGNSIFVSTLVNSSYVIAKSTDFGNTFNNVLFEIGSVYLNGLKSYLEKIFVATGGSGGAVYRSLDYGNSWDEVLNNINARSRYLIAQVQFWLVH